MELSGQPVRILTMPECLLTRYKDVPTASAGLRQRHYSALAQPLSIPRSRMKGQHQRVARLCQAERELVVTEIAEYLSLFRRQALSVSGAIFCKGSRFFRSRKHYAELRGTNMVIYRNEEVASMTKPSNESVIAVLVLADFNIEILQTNETFARIFITPTTATQRELFTTMYIKVRNASAEFEQWRTHLSRARAVLLPSLYTLTVESIIGQGGGGKVFLVRWNMNDRFYALKVINKQKAFLSNRSIRHVASERYLMEKVGPHPFLLPMIFAFQTATNLFIGTPLCAGGDLATYIRKHGLKMTAERSSLYAPECVNTSTSEGGSGKKRKKYYGRLTEETVRIAAAEIILGLKHLHDKGIVYRDLKPENVLIDENGHLKIGDFGLAKHLHMNHSGNGYLRTGSICGTRNYLPPEMLHGKPYSVEADMWSLGVMLYRMLCGCFPFDATRTKEVFKLVRNEHPLLPSVLTPEARSLLGKLLAKDPDCRLTVDQAMKHPFFCNMDFDNMLKLQSPPCITTMNKSFHSNASDILDNFEISRLQGATVGEVLCDSQNCAQLNGNALDLQVPAAMCPKGRLIGFEYLIDNEIHFDQFQPIAISRKSGLFSRIVSFDSSDSLLSPRRSSNQSTLTRHS